MYEIHTMNSSKSCQWNLIIWFLIYCFIFQKKIFPYVLSLLLCSCVKQLFFERQNIKVSRSRWDEMHFVVKNLNLRYVNTLLSFHHKIKTSSKLFFFFLWLFLWWDRWIWVFLSGRRGVECRTRGSRSLAGEA